MYIWAQMYINIVLHKEHYRDAPVSLRSVFEFPPKAMATQTDPRPAKSPNREFPEESFSLNAIRFGAHTNLICRNDRKVYYIVRRAVKVNIFIYLYLYIY